ncbi:hypothetical protein [Prochlorococcus sp. MIT 0801]|uniref:hypothetical protein n=1 Tax=Prochlorococcus sp. MIT 0801 TaxID=1501269 RepID=UPI0004F5E4A1|nr:hypothetical protein [Prochlorococcus sp. MIT 0801]AIQ97577.1 hypothetical protein EW15_1485 [Prochlorococcus sp. MIT 0801]
MTIQVTPIYSRRYWSDHADKVITSYNSNIESLIIEDSQEGNWKINGRLVPYRKDPADAHTTIKKQWGVLIHNDIFRICSSKSEAEEFKEKLLRTIEQIKSIGDEESISYANLFKLSQGQLEVKPTVKRVDLD